MKVLWSSIEPAHGETPAVAIMYGTIDGERVAAGTTDLEYHALILEALEKLDDEFQVDDSKFAYLPYWPDEWPISLDYVRDVWQKVPTAVLGRIFWQLRSQEPTDSLIGANVREVRRRLGMEEPGIEVDVPDHELWIDSPDERSFTADCVCGWVGEEVHNYRVAMAHAQKHWVDLCPESSLIPYPPEALVSNQIGAQE